MYVEIRQVIVATYTHTHCWEKGRESHVHSVAFTSILIFDMLSHRKKVKLIDFVTIRGTEAWAFNGKESAWANINADNIPKACTFKSLSLKANELNDKNHHFLRFSLSLAVSYQSIRSETSRKCSCSRHCFSFLLLALTQKTCLCHTFTQLRCVHFFFSLSLSLCDCTPTVYTCC